MGVHSPLVTKGGSLTVTDDVTYGHVGETGGAHDYDTLSKSDLIVAILIVCVFVSCCQKEDASQEAN